MTTKDLYSKLMAMAQEVKSQDNLATHAPIFMVQQRNRVYGFDTSYSDDNNVYVTSDEFREVSLAERKEDYANDMDDQDVDPDEEIDTDYAKWLELYYQPQPGDTEEYKQECYAQFIEVAKEELFEEWCDDNENYTKTAYQDFWENVQPFFTRKGAEGYIEINGHNLKDPRIYVESAFRNSEWQALRQLLVSPEFELWATNMANRTLFEVVTKESNEEG